jgi:hypothetical protein
MQIKTFPQKFERNFERTIPPNAIAIVRRIAKDLVRKSGNSQVPDQRLEFAHAALHMQIYQRFGTRSNGFIRNAHVALDELITGDSQMNTHIKLPLEFKTPA